VTSKVSTRVSAKKGGLTKTTAPWIPTWSPTVVLARRHPDSLRRSDGMRCFQSPMAVDASLSVVVIWVERFDEFADADTG
jgi:hypothetical protein